MRGGWRAPALGRPPRWEGLGNTACSLECLACLNHVHGWTIWGESYGTLPLKPRFLVASDRLGVARRRVRLDLGDLGIIEQQLNQSSNQLVPKPLPSWMHSPVTGLFAYPGFSSSHHPSPLPRATHDWAYLIGSPFSIAMYGVTDSCAKTLGKYCSCTSASRACFLLAPPLDDMRSI